MIFCHRIKFLNFWVLKRDLDIDTQFAKVDTNKHFSNTYLAIQFWGGGVKLLSLNVQEHFAINRFYTKTSSQIGYNNTAYWTLLIQIQKVQFMKTQYVKSSCGKLHKIYQLMHLFFVYILYMNIFYQFACHNNLLIFLKPTLSTAG